MKTEIDVSALRDRDMPETERWDAARMMMGSAAGKLAAAALSLLGPLLESGEITVADLVKQKGPPVTFSDPVSLGERMDIQVSYKGRIIGWLVVTTNITTATITVESISATPPVEG